MRFFYTLLLVLFTSSLFSQIIFREDFEYRNDYFPGSLPNGWSYEYAEGLKDWVFHTGGRDYNPDYAAQGSYNAMFQVESYANERTKLVTPPIDLSIASAPKLNFWLVQDIWGWLSNLNNDELRVYYRTSFNGNWILLQTYRNAITVWQEQEINLPPEAMSKTLYIAFEGKTRYGNGTCIDDIRLTETGVVPQQVSSFEVLQASSDFVATNTLNNPILCVPIRVQGNSGSLQLKSFKVNSLNTNSADIMASGVKLWITESKFFSNPIQLGTGLSFAGNVVNFTGLNKVLPLGFSYIWVTYDIKSSAKPGNIFDAKIVANAVVFSNSTSLPAKEVSPSGSRTIFEMVYFQNFDNSYSDWQLSSGFEVGAPTGLGGAEGGGSDPSYAVTSPNVLGNGVNASTDLEALYANNLADTSEYAISPTFDLKYYNNAVMRFDQWLNVEGWDEVGIMYSTDGNKSWKYMWNNENVFYNDGSWTARQFDISAFADRQKQIAFRFSLGATNNNVRYSGWNIDNFLIVANFIDKDIALTKWYGPHGGCGLSNAETIKIQIMNTSGKVVNFPVPVGYSFDGGATWVKETINTPIAIGDSLDYTFVTKADLSAPKVYKPIAKVFLDGDEDPKNDTYIVPDLRSLPVYPVPYIGTFEKGSDFWLAQGNGNMTWVLGKPSSALIPKANGGQYAWVTSASSTFKGNDSSEVLSPCFDFAPIENPVFEMAYNCTFFGDVAGAGLQYSTDAGATWSVVPKLEDKWNWYSDSDIKILDSIHGQKEGWAMPTNGWKKAKHYLPTSFKNEGSIRFKVVFASESNGYFSDGFAFDDVRIYNAPPDVGVTALISPVSACELSASENIKVNIRNFGIATIKSGSKVIAGFDVNGKVQCIDTFLLATDLPIGGNLEYTFSKKAKLYDAGMYTVRAYTRMPLDVDFYDETKNNDTTITQIEVYGIPGYTLGADFGAEDPKQITLDAGIDASMSSNYVKYTWDSGASTRTFTLPDAGTYSVTVENARGCTATASINVSLSTRDIVLTDISSPVSACVISELQNVSVTVKNGHTYPFKTGDTLVFAYHYGKSVPVVDTLFLDAPFNPEDELTFTFTEKLDLSVIDTDELTVYSILDADINRNNDTVRAEIGHYGIAKLDFGQDTIYTLTPEGMELSIAKVYESYLWQDGSVLPSFIVNNPEGGRFALTVTALHGCGTATDSVFVSTRDISIGSLVSPVTSCGLSNTETIRLQITNSGKDIIPAGTIIELSAFVDGGTWFTNNVTTLSDVLPGASFEIESTTTSDFSATGVHFIDVAVATAGDVIASNNRISVAVEVIGYPPLTISADTIIVQNGNLPLLNASNGLPDMQYYWNDWNDSEGAMLQVTLEQNYEYIVTVVQNGCFSTDTVMVLTDDFKIDAENANANFCKLGSQEILKTLVQNNSYNSYPVGTELKVSYQVSGQSPVTETLTLASALSGKASIGYVFNTKANLSEQSEYLINYWVDYPIDANRTNDTAEVLSTVVGYPQPDFGFGDTLRTARPDTVELWLDREYDTYQWHDGIVRKDVCYITNPAPQWYKVTVSFDPGCYGSDSLFIETFDVAVSDILSPFSNCTPENTSEVKLRIKNIFDYPIPAGDSLFISYTFHDITNKPYSIIGQKTDTLVLSSEFAGLDVFTYLFKDTLLLENEKSYRIACSVDYYRDAVAKNDTISTKFSIFGNPDLKFAVDTIFTSRADTVIVDAGSNAYTYSWNTGSTSRSFLAPYLSSFQYVFTATDANSCSTSDTLTIISSDIAIGDIISPIDSCTISSMTRVSFEILNTSLDTIANGSKMPYSIWADNVLLLTESVILPRINPGAKTLITALSPVNLSAFDTVELKVKVSYQLDADSTNNIAFKTVRAFGNPVLKLSANKLYISAGQTAKVYPLGTFAHYQWSSAETTDTVIIAGNTTGWTYLTVTDDNGCKATDSVAVQHRDFSVDIISQFSDCKLPAKQSIEFKITNEGVDALSADELVVVRLLIDEEEVFTTSLAIDIAALGTYTYTFPDVYDFSLKNAVTITVVTEIENDVIVANNTATKTMLAYGYPKPKFTQDTIFAPKPSTVTLSVPGSFATYLWQDGSESPSFTNCTPNSAWYHLTVTNDEGCAAKDSIFVFSKDLAVNKIVAPVDACIFADDEAVAIRIINNGSDSFAQGESLFIRLTINGVNLVTDTVKLNVPFASGTELAHTFTKKMSTKSADTFDITVSLFTIYDAIKENNTLSSTIRKTGYPDIAFSKNLLLTNQPDTVKFVFPAKYSYKWSDGSVDNIRNASSDSKQQYRVTATNDIGCSTVDSVTILSIIPSISQLPTIVSACSLAADEQPSLHITNIGMSDISESDGVYVLFTLNKALVSKMPIKNLAAGDTVLLQSTAVFDLSKVGSTYTLGYYTAVDMGGKIIHADSAITQVKHYGYPGDAIDAKSISKALPVTLTAKGANSYSWSNGAITPIIQVTQSGLYYVTAASIDGCEIIDSVSVYGYDLALDSIIFPQGKKVCTSDLELFPQLDIRNNGLDTLRKGTVIGIVFNSTPEDFMLPADLLPAQSVKYKPLTPISTKIGSQSLSAEVHIANDIRTANDNKSIAITMFKSPVFNFLDDVSADTVDVTPPFVLFGPDNYRYLWSNGSTSQSISAKQEGLYVLSIIDANNCVGIDKIYLRMSTSVESLESIRFEVYPTICETEFTIVPIEDVVTSRMYITASGSSITRSYTLGGFSTAQQIYVGDLPSGHYVIKLIADGHMYEWKMIKQ